MRGLTLLRGAAAMLLAVQLPACNFSAGVETLLSPPRLTAEQEQIYQALLAAAGSSVSLKYPKVGEHLSAFTVADLNGDGLDEAIVFYQVSLAAADENPLRVCLLAQQSGGWRAVRDYPAAGAEIERIDIAALGSNPRTNVIIRYSLVDGGDRTAEVYHCDADGLTRSLSVPYSVMELRDLDRNGTTELFAVSAAKAPNPAVATVYSLDGSGQYTRAQAELPEAFTDIARLVYGMLPDRTAQLDIPAVYVDGTAGATNAQTAVLTYRGGLLSTVYSDSAEHIPNTNRPSGCQTADIDGDGEPEIPVQGVFYGYQAGSEVPQLPMTSWYVCRNGLLMRKRSSYYPAGSGYAFLLPVRWERRVTAVQEDEEIVFYEFDRDAQSEDGAPVLKTPLLRLAVVTERVASDALQLDGYLLMRQQNGNYYLGKCERAAGSLAIGENELAVSMRYF